MAGIIDVVIDDREPEEFVRLFRDAGAAEVRVERLGVGDFIVNNRWVFERKTVGDLEVSLVDGRLFRQALAMVKSEWKPVFILEGGAGGAEKCRVSREALQGALITLSVFFGIPLLRALNAAEVVRIVSFTLSQDGHFGAVGVRRGGYRPKRKRARQLFVLEGLPGIGRQKAERLLDAFGSVEDVMTAEENELAEVEGIGVRIARRIRDVLG